MKTGPFEYIKNNRHLLLIIFVPAYIGSYFLLESIIFNNYHAMYMPLDDLIPFCEWFVIPYIMWYPMLLFVGLHLLFTDVPAYKRYMWFLIISFSVSVLVCIVYPNMQLLRPAQFPRENILTALVGSLYGTDTPTNVFPSIHCCGSLAVLFACWDSKSFRRVWTRALLTILPLSICAATVFIKQHSIIDFFGALAVCVPIAAVTLIIKRKRARDNQ